MPDRPAREIPADAAAESIRALWLASGEMISTEEYREAGSLLFLELERRGWVILPPSGVRSDP